VDPLKAEGQSLPPGTKAMDIDERKAMLQCWRYRLQHRANPLHVYCRLMDLGMGRFISRRVCTFYEKVVFFSGRREWRRD
jgi:copper oxidase (laccase) domain-containing protein